MLNGLLGASSQVFDIAWGQRMGARVIVVVLVLESVLARSAGRPAHSEGAAANVLDAPTLVSPSGAISTNPPTYVWNPVSVATWYYLWVSDAWGTPVTQHWYDASVCGASICSVIPPVPVSGGRYTWWVQTWNGSAPGSWSSSLSFSAGQLPATTLISPTGSVSTRTPTYTWAKVSSATWYYLWVQNQGGTPVIQTWYTTASACDTHICSVTPSVTLTAGATHTWWVQTYDDGGYGPWSASLSFTPLAIDVVTYHNDTGRTGQNLSETVLTPINVHATTFGLVGFLPADGPLYAQPLYLSNVAIPGKGAHDVVYAATERDSVYAFDATTGRTLWQVSVLAAGETPSDDRGCGDAVSPEIGITATPVIDRRGGPHGAMYLTATSMDASGNYFQRLHALDITTGAELFGGPTTIQASYPGTGGNSDGENVIFDPAQSSSVQACCC
jgi:hypothetical protein